MTTLRSVLETANGLYRESRTGQGYQRQDLLDKLPDEALDSPVHIRKVSPGIYEIELESSENGRYDLYSRRREARSVPSTTLDDI
jgi:hypothetical protein